MKFLRNLTFLVLAVLMFLPAEADAFIDKAAAGIGFDAAQEKTGNAF